jgi:tetrahydromethanopterin S-methyltransferase subunit G
MTRGEQREAGCTSETKDEDSLTTSLIFNQNIRAIHHPPPRPPTLVRDVFEFGVWEGRKEIFFSLRAPSATAPRTRDTTISTSLLRVNRNSLCLLSCESQRKELTRLVSFISAMLHLQTHRIQRLLLFFSTFLILECEAWKKKEAAEQEEQQWFVLEDEDDIPGVPWLVEMLGEEIYRMVNRPKYKFYLYMTIGKLPDENSTVAALSTLCNVLYGWGIVVGFWCLPRGKMLAITLMTLFVGPALVLILLGLLAALTGSFAMYPVTSVSVVWLVYFMTSQVAQAVGRKMGLDSDGDGDVDFLDLLHAAGRSRMGKYLGLQKLHAWLDEATRDPFQEIHRRLDEIQRQTDMGQLNGDSNNNKKGQ